MTKTPFVGLETDVLESLDFQPSCDIIRVYSGRDDVRCDRPAAWQVLHYLHCPAGPDATPVVRLWCTACMKGIAGGDLMKCRYRPEVYNVLPRIIRVEAL